MSIVMSVDPGMSTGIVVARISDEAPPVLRGRFQVEQGLSGLNEWIDLCDRAMDSVTRLVCEKWHPRPTSRVYRLDELEPVRIEGMLQTDYGDVIMFRQPEQRHLFRETETFSKSAAFLKWAGYWTTGSEVGCKDANDTNSAMMHLFGYLRDNKHGPTISLLLDYQSSIREEGTQ